MPESEKESENQQALTVIQGDVIPWEQAKTLDVQRLPNVTVAYVTGRALAILTAPTPPAVIKRRKGPNGKMLDYVPHGWYRARLNEAFGWDWDWIRDEVAIKLEEDTVLFFGHLVIRVRNPLTGDLLTTLTKSGEGGAAIQRFNSSGAIIDLGNDVKSASSEAFKRACLNLGLGLDLYWKDEEPDEQEGNGHNGNHGNTGNTGNNGHNGDSAGTGTVACEGCGAEISGGIDAKGKPFSAADIQKASLSKFGKHLCYACFKKARDGA